jgi:outer membrane protein
MSRSLLSGAAALLLLPFLAVPAAAQEAPVPRLSLEEAVDRALQLNPEVVAQRSRLQPAEGAVRAAMLDFLPTASASSSLGYSAPGERWAGSVRLGEQPAIYSSSYRLGMNYSLSGSTLLQPSLARAQQRAVEERVTGIERSIEAQVTQQYLTVLQAEEAVSLARQEVARTREHVRLAEARAEVGAGTMLDIRRSQVQEGQAELRLVQGESNLIRETLALGRLIGESLPERVELTTRFELSEPDLDAGALLARALRVNPTLLALRAQVDASQARVTSARSAYFPSLNLSAGFTGQIQQPQGEDLGFPFGYRQQPFAGSLGISIPVFTGYTRRLQVEEARASANETRQSVRAEELRLEAEVRSAVRAVEAAHRAALLGERVRETAEEELRLATERLRQGAGTSVEVTDAQASLAQAEQQHLDSVYVYHKSLAALEGLVGQPLR